jgi:hypothetical protein
MSSTPTPNHIRIYRDNDGKHITLDGHELLLAEDGILIDGAENPNEITKMHLTLFAPTITIDSEVESVSHPTGDENLRFRLVMTTDEIRALHPDARGIDSAGHSVSRLHPHEVTFPAVILDPEPEPSRTTAA